jgi:SPP1 gp7 family putative phage head morphogenesis protein
MPKPLKDVFIRHGINLTRYSTHEARKLLDILDTANTQIKSVITKAKAIETKKKYYRVAAKIKRITNECGEQLDGQLKFDFKELADTETAFVSNALKSAGVKVDFDIPATSKIWSAASFGSYADGHETFETYLNGLSENMYKTWDTQVRAGYLTGMTAKQINRAVLGSADGLDPGQMQVLRRSLETNTRTMVASMSAMARNAVYEANSKLFSGYRYVGTLDSRTCLVCGELDGKVFKEIEEAPKLPRHHNCRCLLVPIVKGMEEKDEDDTRASVDGPVSANMSYQDWLKTQLDEVVRDILGPARFEMYKRGEEISGFVADGRTLTLKQLKETEGLKNSYHWTPERIAEMESSLRKSDDIFVKLSSDEAKSLINEIRTNYPDKIRFANDIEQEVKRLEMSEQFTEMMMNNGIAVPHSNVKVDIDEDMFNKLMTGDLKEKWLNYVKQAEALDDGWGYANKDNRRGQAFIFVNGGEYRPIAKDGMIYDFKGYTDVGDIATALRSRNFAAENVSRITVPELLRAEKRPSEWVAQLKKGDSIPLSGVTSFSANERHLVHYTSLLQDRGEFKGRGDAVINYHLVLNDEVRNRAMFLQLDDCRLGNTDWSKCSEIALSGSTFFVERTDYNEQKNIWDVFVKLK